MPLDHYIPQVYLRKFYSPKLGKRMFATRKRDLLTYQCDAYSQCRKMNGSTNPFLSEPRAIEVFLKTIENRYNTAEASFREGSPTPDDVYVIAGLAAYISTCSPAAERIHTEPIKGILELTAGMLDDMGALPPAPPEFGGLPLRDLIRTGQINFNVDGDYPKAIGISTIIEMIFTLGNGRWDIISNDHDGAPFFTSDYPIAMEPREGVGAISRIFPLSPNLAVRITPDFNRERRRQDFDKFRFRRLQPPRSDIVSINRLIVRAGESVIFHRDDADWIPKFISKHRNYRVESWNTILPATKGNMHVSEQGIRAYDHGGTDGKTEKVKSQI